jgi:hypothetical protein
MRVGGFRTLGGHAGDSVHAARRRSDAGGGARGERADATADIRVLRVAGSRAAGRESSLFVGGSPLAAAGPMLRRAGSPVRGGVRSLAPALRSLRGAFGRSRTACAPCAGPFGRSSARIAPGAAGFAARGRMSLPWRCRSIASRRRPAPSPVGSFAPRAVRRLRATVPQLWASARPRRRAMTRFGGDDGGGGICSQASGGGVSGSGLRVLARRRVRRREEADVWLREPVRGLRSSVCGAAARLRV